VLASRGTEPDDLLAFLTDAITDTQIVAGVEANLIAQMNDAKDFLCEVMKVDSVSEIDTSKLDLVGHSLGGGITEDLAYLTGATATTFNAVGIGQCLPDGAASEKLPNLTEYIDVWDVVGNTGEHLGNVIYVKNDQTVYDEGYVCKYTDMERATDPVKAMEESFNYYIFCVKDGIYNDTVKYWQNVASLGTAYSHSLSNFLNDIDLNTGEYSDMGF
jgi:hypothetical protein